jgi:hypothetical protein
VVSGAAIVVRHPPPVTVVQTQADAAPPAMPSATRRWQRIPAPDATPAATPPLLGSADAKAIARELVGLDAPASCFEPEPSPSPPDEHKPFFMMVDVEIRVRPEGGVGRVVDARVLPSSDPAIRQSDKTDRCVLQVVRAHVFAAPATELTTYGALLVFPPTNPSEPTPPPPDPATTDQLLHAVLAKMAQRCARGVHVTMPQGGVLRVRGDEQGHVVSLSVTPSGKRDDGLEACLREHFDGAAWLRHGRAFEVPFATP